jgi:ribosomal protein S18 acetylase RimI-like enzyme
VAARAAARGARRVEPAAAPRPETDPPPFRVRPLREDDLAEVARIDALHTGLLKRDYWERLFRDFLHPDDGRFRVGLAADGGEGLAGYLLGEVRAFEFGSEACGWVYAVAVDPGFARSGIPSRLLEEACRRFHEAGVGRVRTMVRRNDVPVLAFFRSNGFSGGSYVQLERDVTGLVTGEG